MKKLDERLSFFRETLGNIQPDLKDDAAQFIEILKSKFQFDYCWYFEELSFVIDGEDEYLQGYTDFINKLSEKNFPDSNYEFRYCSDASQSEEFKEFYTRFGFKTILFIPLFSDFNFPLKGVSVIQRTNELLVFNSKTPDSFSPDEIEDLSIMCNLFASRAVMTGLSMVLANYHLSNIHDSPLGLITVTNQNRAILINDAALKILGLTHDIRKEIVDDEKLPVTIDKLFPESKREQILNATEKLHENEEKTIKLEFWLSTKQEGNKKLIRIFMQRYGRDDLVGRQEGNLRINIILDDITKEYERFNLQKELEIAKDVQKGFLPKTNFVNDTVETYGFTYPAKQVGGDYYDFIPHKQQLNTVIADVSGKGVSAALIMSSLKTSLLSFIEIDLPLQAIMEKMNAIIYEISASDKFITMFLGCFDFHTNRFIYCNAGHNFPIWIKNSGEIQVLDKSSLILGGFPDVPYELEDIFLESGDALLFYTDGITEAINGNDEEFGEQRLLDAVKSLQSADIPPKDLVESIIKKVNQFRGNAEQADDITIFAMKVKRLNNS
jgi:serine phosphatase RsbU (regulator of sigma subunit)